MHRPSLGIYGPAGSDRSGVTEYLDLLEEQLRCYCNCVRVSNANYCSPRHFDKVLYNIGNNLLHRCVFQALRERQGPAIIHEFMCLDYFLSDWDLLPESERAFLLRGYSQVLGETFRSGNELRWCFEKRREFDRYSVDIRSESLFIDKAGPMVLHSRSVSDFLARRYQAKLFRTIPFPVMPTAAILSDVRQRMGIPADAFVFGSFGFIGEYKRLEKVFLAWERLEKEFPEAYLVVVGERQYEIAIPSSNRIVYHSYLEDSREFDQWLLSIDCGIQLRFPSLGETSATISKLLAHQIPVIVSRIPFMSQLLQSEYIYSVSPDACEVETLCDCMKLAHARPPSPRAYDPNHSPEGVATQLFDMIVSE